MMPWFWCGHPYACSNYSSFIQDLGCTYAPLISIPKKAQPTPSDIPDMLPWHTLVCDCVCNQTDSNGNPKNLPQRVAASVKRAYQRNKNNIPQQFEKWEQDLNFNVNENTPPDWVDLLSKMDAETLSADGNADHPSSEIDNYLNEHDLHGVAIIREEPKD